MSDVERLVREAREDVRRRRNGRDWGPHLDTIEALCDALEEKERLVQAWEGAVRRVRSTYPESVFRPGPPYRTIDAQSADWARRVCDNIIAGAKEAFEASEAGEAERGAG